MLVKVSPRWYGAAADGEIKVRHDGPEGPNAGGSCARSLSIFVLTGISTSGLATTTQLAQAVSPPRGSMMMNSGGACGDMGKTNGLRAAQVRWSRIPARSAISPPQSQAAASALVMS